MTQSGMSLFGTLDKMSFDDLERIAQAAYESGSFNARNHQDLLMRLLYAKEMGIPSMAGLMGIRIIKGNATLSSHLISALIKRSIKYNYKVAKFTERECSIDFFEDGKLEGNFSFSMADAQRAGLLRGDGTWEKFPRSLLFARAISGGQRTYCPDTSVSPLYTPGEVPDSYGYSEEQLAAMESEENPADVPDPEPPKGFFASWLQSKFGDDRDEKRKATMKIYGLYRKTNRSTCLAEDPQTMYREIDDALRHDLLTVIECDVFLLSEDVVESELKTQAEPPVEVVENQEDRSEEPVDDEPMEPGSEG